MLSPRNRSVFCQRLGRPLKPKLLLACKLQALLTSVTHRVAPSSGSSCAVYIWQVFPPYAGYPTCHLSMFQFRSVPSIFSPSLALARGSTVGALLGCCWCCCCWWWYCCCGCHTDWLISEPSTVALSRKRGSCFWSINRVQAKQVARLVLRRFRPSAGE